MIVRHCPICNSIISHGRDFCSRCFETIQSEYLDSYIKRCPVCLYPRLNNLYSCSNCNKDDNFKVLSISDYRSFFSRQILLDFKLGGHKEYVKLIACVYEQNLKKYFDSDIVLVPIPCSPSSFKVRGYNHMQLICDCLTSYKTFDILGNRGTLQQKHLNRNQRIEVSKNKFFLKDSLLLPYDSKIVLADDITTTGSTLNACQELLSEAGYCSVSAITWFIEF